MVGLFPLTDRFSKDDGCELACNAWAAAAGLRVRWLTV
jgi:hypothetical protein